jgi:hypothetical protein
VPLVSVSLSFCVESDVVYSFVLLIDFPLNALNQFVEVGTHPSAP